MEKRIGRPRDPRIDARIMRETRRQLRKHGYRGLRVAAVAEAAGVTAPTVRLRWPDVIAGTMVMRILMRDGSTKGLQDELVDLLLRGIGARLNTTVR